MSVKETANGLRERTNRWKAAGVIPTDGKTPQPVVRTPSRVCLYEGPVVESASCGCRGAEDFHVRLCHHPNPTDPDRDKCTRQPVGPAVQACTTCPDQKFKVDDPDPPGILLTGGIGDAFALESMMPVEERDQLERVCYASPATREIRALFMALPNYPKLRRHDVLPTGSKSHYIKDTVEADTGRDLARILDWSIAVEFPKNKTYVGSSFLIHRLADPPHPGKPYVVVVPHSTWGRWDNRDFSADDWRMCLAILDELDLLGVVLCREKLEIPDHPRLVNWQGKTGILESVEILKRADGYLGIDSGLSVLAAKLFPGNRLSVKSVWSHCLNWKHVYFAPWMRYDFLQPYLDVTRWLT